MFALNSYLGQGPSTSIKNQTLSSLKTSTTCTKTRSSAAKRSTLGAGAKRTFVKASWSIKNELLEHDEKDPTTMIANLKRIKAAAETQGYYMYMRKLFTCINITY